MTIGSAQERKSLRPFQNSLSALAQLALHETGAGGYAFFRHLPDTHRLTQYTAYGVDITEEAVIHGSEKVVTYSLGKDGVLAFAFHDADESRKVKPQLDRVMAAIESVWSAAQTSIHYSELASHVAELETRLLDSRISDRVRGYLGRPAAPGTFDAIVRHVEGVLSPKSTGRALERLSEELEAEVEERRLTNRAKAILQSVHGMSEEQAHVHLRQTSRRTRRKIKDIAADLIQSHPVQNPLQGQGC